MKWNEAVRRFRLDKNAAEPGEYSVKLCALRAGMLPNDWSRMEHSQSVTQDGTVSMPTIRRLHAIAAGLQEPVVTIYALVGLTGQVQEEESSESMMGRRISRLLATVPMERKTQVEEALWEMAQRVVAIAA